MKQALLGSQIFCGERFYDHHALLIDDKSIVNIVDKNDIPDNFNKIELDEGILAPGFIDLQVNGGGGTLFNNSPNQESLKNIIRAHQFFGTTSIMPTVISDSLKVLEQCIKTVTEETKNNSYWVFILRVRSLMLNIEGCIKNNILVPLTLSISICSHP